MRRWRRGTVRAKRRMVTFLPVRSVPVLLSLCLPGPRSPPTSLSCCRNHPHSLSLCLPGSFGGDFRPRHRVCCTVSCMHETSLIPASATHQPSPLTPPPPIGPLSHPSALTSDTSATHQPALLLSLSMGHCVSPARALAGADDESEDEVAGGGPARRHRKPIAGKEVSVRRARNVLRSKGGYPEEVIEASITLLDPTDSGVITMVDFYDTFQRKKKEPARRQRGGTPALLLQSKSFPAGLKRPDASKLDVMFAGIGAQFANRRRGEGAEAEDLVVVVADVASGGPADGAAAPDEPHLEVGDEVVKVEGIPVDGLSAGRAYVFTLGGDGTPCELVVRRADAQGIVTKRVITLTRLAGFEDFSKLHPQADTVREAQIVGPTPAEDPSASRRRRSDKVAAAASEALRFYVKRGPPPQGSASVGLELARDDNGGMVVRRVQAGSPAAESGEIAAGDVVHFIEVCVCVWFVCARACVPEYTLHIARANLFGEETSARAVL